MTKEQLLSMDKLTFLKRTKDPKAIELFTQIKYQFLMHQRREELRKHLPIDLTINMLPSRIVDYLMNIQEGQGDKEIHRKIKAIKDEAKQLLKSIKKEIEKPIQEQRIKLGELATFIAKDIINLVIDQDVKHKITTPYYNKLQNKIAYFSLNKETIIALGDELQLFDKKVGHVFLTKNLINGSSGIIDFYLNYLEEKIYWIEDELFIKGKKGGYVLPDRKKIPLSFEKIRKDTVPSDFKLWLHNKSQKPVDLPITLFDVQLEQSLKGRLRNLKVEYNPHDNFSVLLGKYLGNDTQPYYLYKRKYNKGKDDPVEFWINGLSSKDMKADYGKFVTANEKLIRFTQTKDRTLKLMCDKLLCEDKSIGLNDKFSLQEIHPNSKHNPLESHASFEQRIFSTGIETFFTIVAKDNQKQLEEIETFRTLQTDEEKQSYNGQKWYQWTIKDFGRFKRFVTDRRIPNLTDYIADKVIPFDLLEYQIKEYDKYREKIFELTFNLERTIDKLDFPGIKEIEFRDNQRPKGFFEIKFKVYLEWLNQTGIQYDRDLIDWTRNKFSHSEFPILPSISKITKQQMADFEYNKHTKDYKNNADISVAAKIYNCYSLEITSIIMKIEELYN